MENEYFAVIASVPAMILVILNIFKAALKLLTGEEHFVNLFHKSSSKVTLTRLIEQIESNIGDDILIQELKNKQKEEAFYEATGIKTSYEKIPFLISIKEKVIRNGLNPYKIDYISNFLQITNNRELITATIKGFVMRLAVGVLFSFFMAFLLIVFIPILGIELINSFGDPYYRIFLICYSVVPIFLVIFVKNIIEGLYDYWRVLKIKNIVQASEYEVPDLPSSKEDNSFSVLNDLPRN